MTSFNVFVTRNPKFLAYFGHEKAFKHYCWELYKIDWLFCHGYTPKNMLQKLVSYVTAIKDDIDTDADPDDVIDGWESDDAMDGSCYACYAEFLDSEFRNPDYMKKLLAPEDLITYKTIRNMEDKG
ncbi:MAG: hypothetical protein HDQ88_07810 [Clostridia bacterium]|nr:hypothetical protein [Clostridia bacterium]